MPSILHERLYPRLARPQGQIKDIALDSVGRVGARAGLHENRCIFWEMAFDVIAEVASIEVRFLIHCQHVVNALTLTHIFQAEHRWNLFIGHINTAEQLLGDQ